MDQHESDKKIVYARNSKFRKEMNVLLEITEFCEETVINLTFREKLADQNVFVPQMQPLVVTEEIYQLYFRSNLKELSPCLISQPE